MAVDLNDLTLADKLIAGSTIAFLIFMFFPWFGFSGFPGGGNGMDTGALWSLLPLLLGIFMTVWSVLPKVTETKLPDLPVPHGLAMLIAGGLAAALVVLKLIIGVKICGFGECVKFDRKIGLYLATIAALGMAAGGFLKYSGKEEGTDSGPSTAPPTPF